MGGILAKYATEGVETYLITATRGERGWTGAATDNPGLVALGQIREAELQAAAAILGLKEVIFLDYLDGDLDQADPLTITRQLVAHIRRIRPDVVITFDPKGIYGHPDHIAISQFTTAAMVSAAMANGIDAQYGSPHQVAKLYYFAESQTAYELYEEVFGDLVMTIDGKERRSMPWQDWAITTEVDTAVYWKQVWSAITCHQSQLPNFEALQNLPSAKQKKLWRHQTFYRAYSLVNGGRKVETDLFAGLR
jgi:LmbE family N-acetylglucosaminyl deacetylase